MVTKIEMIRVGDIYSNPFNPRTELGDLEELTESVKKDGILQNLTVFPGHYEDEELKPGGYTLLIGHRRLACAKAAGLTEVPCGIEETMPVSDQVSYMMVENGDRENLTVYDEARGIQLMLDFGETEDSIAEKTGFSKKTVKRRAGIAKLDQDIIREKEKDPGFQMNLTDLYELEKIDDMELRNRILKEADSSRNLKWKVEQAVAASNREKNFELLKKLFEGSGIEQLPIKNSYQIYSDRWIRLAEYSIDKAPLKDMELPDEEEPMFYYKAYNSVYVVRKAPKRELTKHQKAQRELNKKARQVKAVLTEMDARRRDFVLSMVSGKIRPVKDTGKMEHLCWQAIRSMGVTISNSGLYQLFTDKSEYRWTKEEREEILSKTEKMDVVTQMLVLVHQGMQKNVGELTLHNGGYNAVNGQKLLRGYEIFSEYGWSFEDGEKEILNGNSELYTAS